MSQLLHNHFRVVTITIVATCVFNARILHSTAASFSEDFLELSGLVLQRWLSRASLMGVLTGALQKTERKEFHFTGYH